MTADPEPTALSLLGRLLPGGSVHVIAAGATLECRDDRWRSVLAVVEHGCIELVTDGGARLRLGEGAMFSLARLGPVAVRATGTDSAVISTVGRPAKTGAAGD